MSSILVLDDRATERDLLCTVLGDAGHLVARASTRQEALAMAQARVPDLVIVDLIMPQMSGPEFVRELRGDPELESVKVMLCTATYDEREVRVLPESCGVVHALIKPCEREEIIRAVSEVLSAEVMPSRQLGTDHFNRAQLRVLAQLRALNTNLIDKIDEPDCGKRRTEEKAKQRVIASKYKSELLSDMSHELRTPLNSLLMLTRELRANPGQNLTAAQVQYATMIESSGMDLLHLLTDLLGNGHVGLASPPARRLPELVPGTSGRHDLGLRPAPQTELAASIRLAGNTVLVVDDDFRNLFAITALLERSGLQVVAAESGEAGIAVLKETQDIDIVLMDIMMPGMDGYATMREIHKMPGTQQLPIVALTAKTGDEVRQRCVDAGACAYVSKPVSTRDILDVLCEWLSRPKMTGRPVGVSS